MFINFQKKALKGLKKADIFAQPVQLLIKQEDGHKTLFGAFLTLALIAFFIYMLIVNLLIMWERKNPTSLSTEVFHSSPEYFKLVPENFTLTFAFQTSDYLTYIDESIYVAEATITTKKTNIVDGKKSDDWSSVSLPLTTCSDDLLRQEALKEYYQHLDLSTNYCIDWNKIEKLDLQGTFDSSDYSFLIVQFKMCNQDTKKSKECRPRDEIKQKLEQNYFSLQMSSYVIDIKSQSPFIPKGEDMFTTISSKIFKEISFYMQPINVLTDLGFIQEDYQSEKSLRYRRNTEMLDLNESDLIINVVIRLDQIEQQYYRSYSKIQTILSQMGGLWQVFFTAALIITKPINLLSYYVRILNSLFEFESQKKKIKQNAQQNDEIEDPDSQVGVFSAQRALEHQQSLQKKNQAFLRLKSIQFKKKQIEVIENQQATDPQTKEIEKQQLSKAISFSIKQYFRSISKKLRMKWTDYLYFVKCFVNSQNYKSTQIEYSVKKIIKQMDILYIMKKLQEIDKLKMILLSESQIKLFDYLQKPTIPVDPSQYSFNTNHQYYSILKPMKSDYQRAIDAQVAFKDIVANLDNPVNIKLLNSIDKSIVDLLKLRKNTEFISQEGECISEQAQEKQKVMGIEIKKNFSMVDFKF